MEIIEMRTEKNYWVLYSPSRRPLSKDLHSPSDGNHLATTIKYNATEPEITNSTIK